MHTDMDRPAVAMAEQLTAAIHDTETVSGLTHEYYRYPARFSPRFAHAAIDAFTRPGDLVMDPFAGGGTTLVEAAAMGRSAIGLDINPLANFIARAKTTHLSDGDLADVAQWLEDALARLQVSRPPIRPWNWIDEGYQRNIDCPKTWRVRKLIELSLHESDRLRYPRQRRFARCALLRTGQWALDCRDSVPSVSEFRAKFAETIGEMAAAMRDYRMAVRVSQRDTECGSPRMAVTRCPADRATQALKKASMGAPRLILTSPPYAGVHVLYHRWQVEGRRETPAPFWIAGCRDGHGESFYTMGGRHQEDLADYFKGITTAFCGLAQVADSQTLIAQLVGFSQPHWQLPRYLEAMNAAGLCEVQASNLLPLPHQRIWRSVPNRKWYAERRPDLQSSREVVLFHRRA